jgi:hypothetical protein
LDRQAEFSLGWLGGPEGEAMGPIDLYVLSLTIVLVLGFVLLVPLMPLNGGPVVGAGGYEKGRIITDRVRKTRS